MFLKYRLIGLRKTVSLLSEMNKRAYNVQDIRHYLLGSLPDAEQTELLDELSFTDDEFAAALKAAENDLVDAYVRGELKGAELERFEKHYLASPLRRERVTFAQSFQLFAEKTTGEPATRGGAEVSSEPAATRKVSVWLSSLNPFTAWRPALQWGAAFAALALVVACGWLLFENSRLRGRISQAQAGREALGRREIELQKELESERAAGAATGLELARVREERERTEQELKREREQQRAASQQRSASPGGFGIASFILTPQTRGVGQIQTISVSARATDVLMRLELEPNDYSTYRVALLEEASSRTLWRSGKLGAKATGAGRTLDVRFRAGLLKPQAVYTLRVTGIRAAGANEIVSDYPFRVVK
jgi:hypothetical protein